MIELFFSSGEPIALKEVDIRDTRTRIPGTFLLTGGNDKFSIHVQQLELRDYAMTLRSMKCESEYTLRFQERFKGIRLEIVLSGELNLMYSDGKQIKILTGQYHLSNQTCFQVHAPGNSDCSYVSFYYSPQLLSAHGLTNRIGPSSPARVPERMWDIVSEILLNHYDDGNRSLYYAICVPDILLEHITRPPISSCPGLTDEQVAIIRKIDNYMLEHMGEEILMKDLQKFSKASVEFIRKGFMIVFGMNPFARYSQMRMDKAKVLLEKTNKALKEIYQLTGYKTMSSFITEFRKRFGISPYEWRREKRGY